MHGDSPVADETVGLFEAVDLGDVRMVERREELCFAFESAPSIAIVREGSRHHLESDVALQPSVGGAIDLAHSAFGNEGGDGVRAETRPASQAHLS